MQHIIYLILRRMRTPLIVLICAYAISITGFVLIPGQDDQGQPWSMGFFHAFYFVSFMGSTIGFGEIPYPFTDAQRLWTLFTIYATVISWLYAIGAMLALIQTPLFQSAVTRNAFIRRVKNIHSPFYIVCGYGDTGRLMVDALTAQGIYCVVIDQEEARINELELENHILQPVSLIGDATDPEILSRAGLNNRFCKGVVAVTRSDSANLTIAIASKLINPEVEVFCWAETHETGANMASFGTDHIINPYDTFAEYFSTSLISPSRYLLQQWLSSPNNTPLCDPVFPPKGRWLLCGFGRFGKAIYKELLSHGLPVTVIDHEPEVTHPPSQFIEGWGTEAETLKAAEIHKAVGIIAGTHHDINNLSIILTARELNPKLFTIARQETSFNREMFLAANIDLVTNHSSLTSSQLLAQITTPLTATFIEAMKSESDEWARHLVSRLAGCIDDTNPDSWVISISYQKTPGYYRLFGKGKDIQLQHLIREPSNRKKKLPCIALLLQRDGKEILLPDEETLIYPHDRILFAGDVKAKRRTQYILSSEDILHYTMTGINRPSSYFGQWLSKIKNKPQSSS